MQDFCLPFLLKNKLEKFMKINKYYDCELFSCLFFVSEAAASDIIVIFWKY